jgi:hypothetical protein
MSLRESAGSKKASNAENEACFWRATSDQHEIAHTAAMRLSETAAAVAA